MKIDYWQTFEEGCFYHIYNHAAGDKNIFNSEEDYIDFLNKHEKYLSCVFDTIAYCLMPNHFHFLVQLKTLDVIKLNTKKETSKISLSLHRGESDINAFVLDQYRRYLSSFALAYNHRNKHRGQLFLKRFKRVSLGIGKLINMICYIHHNPIHHGFTKDYKSWPYSSYKEYLNRELATGGILKLGDSGKIDKPGLEYFNDKKDFLQHHQDFKLFKAEEISKS
jgi:REP element-mobilizing transposase RayT